MNDVLRPPQGTPVSRLTLAGDYTQEPYLATMEGAVTPGRLAAKEAVHQRPGRRMPVRTHLPLSAIN